MSGIAIPWILEGLLSFIAPSLSESFWEIPMSVQDFSQRRYSTSCFVIFVSPPSIFSFVSGFCSVSSSCFSSGTSASSAFYSSGADISCLAGFCFGFCFGSCFGSYLVGYCFGCCFCCCFCSCFGFRGCFYCYLFSLCLGSGFYFLAGILNSYCSVGSFGM